MKRFSLISLPLAAALCCCDPVETDPIIIDPVEDYVEAGITYQLLVYSFCDSDGDGCGDFKGIESKLEYLKSLGASALWLSPIHPATSYHGYDVNDYNAVNPLYGTEADFRSLVDKAHDMDIKIYIDFVLNHTSRDNPWFTDAKSSETSPHRDWYHFSRDPQADVKAGKFPMMPKTAYNSGEWTACTTAGGSARRIKFTLTVDSNKKPKTLTATQADEIKNNGTQNTGLYLYYGDDKSVQFYSDYSVTLDIDSSWGVLVRTTTSSWSAGTKYGAKQGSNTLEWGKPLAISPSTSSYDPSDILLPGMDQWYYLSVFGSYMPDINYGAVDTCENSPAFKAVAAAADKWIDLGVDGFRLDAVKHIYHNAGSDENPTFLRKFYDHCNATYKAAGHTDDIYMVGEVFTDASEVAPYYKGLPAYFEFSFWWKLRDALQSSDASSFVRDIESFRTSYGRYRDSYIAATKLTNHDEDRAASSLDKDTDKLKMAASVLMTYSGEPYIYQGEELGYWGTKSGGDEYVRTPILWTRSASSAASGMLGGKVDASMLTSSISVESQSSDDFSLLQHYRTLAALRQRFPALSQGSLAIRTYSSAPSSVCSWYRMTDGQKILVVHNFGGIASFAAPDDNLDRPIATFGSVTAKSGRLTMGPNSTALFLQ